MRLRVKLNVLLVYLKKKKSYNELTTSETIFCPSEMFLKSFAYKIDDTVYNENCIGLSEFVRMSIKTKNKKDQKVSLLIYREIKNRN